MIRESFLSLIMTYLLVSICTSLKLKKPCYLSADSRAFYNNLNKIIISRRRRTMQIFKSYKTVLNRKYIIVYLIYFSFFLVNGPLEKIIPILFTSIGFDEKTYGVFLSLNTFIHIFLPGFVGFLAHKFNMYKIAIIGMILSLAGAFFQGLLQYNMFTFFL